MHRRVGVKRFLVCVASWRLFLCTGTLVLSGFAQFLEAQCASFVDRYVGFQDFCRMGSVVLCTGALVFSDFYNEFAGFVHRHVGFKDLYELVPSFCAQARGF